MPDHAEKAAEWLLAEFDTADPADLSADRYDYDTDHYWRPVYVQPMFTLKSATDPGTKMQVNQADYNDPMRWWL